MSQQQALDRESTRGAKSGQPVVTRLSETMGAEIEGVDLARPLTDDAFAQIARAFRDHKLIVFRGQTLTPAEIQAFAERFGPIEGHTILRADGQGVLEAVHYVSNLDASGKPSQKPHINANYYWHSDKAHYPVPALLSMLYSIELPPNGGETEFANTEMAYEDLPPAMKERIDGLQVENDFTYAMDNIGKTLTDAERKAVPPVVHPLVRTHPDTGRKYVFVGMYSKRIIGMPDAEGQALVKELTELATQPRYTFRHQWQVGDLVVWDNRGLVHRAVMNYEMTQHRRVLMRCVVKGTAPA